MKADLTQLGDKLGERYEIARTNIKNMDMGSPIQAPLDALADSSNSARSPPTMYERWSCGSPATRPTR